ncbi:MAG: DUF3427 domain-containing protein [Spirochaetota bacterium]
MDNKLPVGLYEKIVTELLDQRLSRLERGLLYNKQKLDEADSHIALAQHIECVVEEKLRAITGEDKLKKQVDLCNDILSVLNIRNESDGYVASKICSEAVRLLQIYNEVFEIPHRPDTSLAVGSLLTATGGDPSLVSQLKQEILSADRVDILVSFIKWSGIRIIKEELEKLTKDRPLRIITTSYLGATDIKAIKYLLDLPNTKVWVSFDTKRTRLHAKAFMFLRHTGYSSAYVGSSNISNPAMTEGLEWNVKICEADSPHLWRKTQAAFETYQRSLEFECISCADLPRLASALDKERTGNSVTSDSHLSFFDVHPYAYQQEILDRLKAEREIHGRNRNLVVAATGTGKTVVAAFDFARCFERPRRTRMMFVAHREEILKQSMNVFRNVLRDQNFGELWVGESQAIDKQQLFISVQTFNTQRLWETLPPDFYEYIVIDEFHHAAAASYQCLMEHFSPQHLLGLTATPERADGQDILHYFNNHIAAEMRLPDAINRKLLSPFQYFCIADNTVDFSRLQWTRGGYDRKALDGLLNGNDARAMLVMQKINEILLAPSKSRGLCFCVSQAHASFMAKKLVEGGIKATALTSESSENERSSAISKLQNYEINFLCVVDLFNEGVDIPEVDTILFLRPTESLTVFLQQLGRGLRLSQGKEHLTVLDFVSKAHRRFNFEERFKALIDSTPRDLETEIIQSFPSLPAGCMIEMEKLAQQYVLENISEGLSYGNTAGFLERIREFANERKSDVTLGGFLDFYGIKPQELYKRGSWSRLCVRAGIKPDFTAPDEDVLTRGLRRFCHQNSAKYIKLLSQALAEVNDKTTEASGNNVEINMLLTMVCFSMWNGKPPEKSIGENIARIKRNKTIWAELCELVEYLYSIADAVVYTPVLPFPCALSVHACYTRDEIFSGIGHWTVGNAPSVREGVKHVKELNTDVFFITLNKTEKDYSPTTMYEDYAIDADHFHWQSQSTTGEHSPTGQRYINHKSQGAYILLFVRENKQDDNIASPYYFLGTAEYVSHIGNNPMSITWKLHQPLPGKLIRNTVRMSVA